MIPYLGAVNWDFARDISGFVLYLFVAIGLSGLLYGWRVYRIARKLKARAKALWIKFVLRMVALAGLVTALLGPLQGTQLLEEQTKQRDIWLLLDMTASMGCQDMLGPRLQRARTIIENLVAAHPGDRFGLISFADTAWVECPLTYDHETLVLIMNALELRYFTNRGTAIGQALKPVTFASRVPKANQAPPAVMVFSDGEGNERYAEDDASFKKIRDSKAMVCLVGIGSQKPTPIPVQGKYLRAASGRLLYSQRADGTLREMKSALNAELVLVNPSDDALPQLKAWLKTVKSRTWENRKTIVAADRYAWPLLVTVLAIVADVVITINVIPVGMRKKKG